MISMYQPQTGATDDASLIRMWLLGKRQGTQHLYTRTVRQFLSFAGVSISDVRLEDQPSQG